MLLVRLAIGRGGSAAGIPMHCLRGSVIARCTPSLTLVKPRFKTTQKSADEEIDLEAPIKFSTSRAATWKSRETYSGKKTEVDKQLWYEPIVVTLSMSVFLLYFCYLREENSVDDKFVKTLYEHIDGLEEKQLELSLQYNLEAGKDTEAIKNRLAELKEDKD